MSERTAFPLSWPDGWKRTQSISRTHAQFGRTERKSTQPGGPEWLNKKQLSVADSVGRLLGETSPHGNSGLECDHLDQRPLATQHWREVLGIQGSASAQLVEDRFRALAQVHHPDKGGDRNKFEEIVQARDAARLELAA